MAKNIFDFWERYNVYRLAIRHLLKLSKSTYILLNLNGAFNSNASFSYIIVQLNYTQDYNY
ncbi:hypothetical protein SKB0123_20410 [Staphylococcus capitis]|nr:hypothetical protein GCM10008141_17760 [Staphylococcus capitis]